MESKSKKQISISFHCLFYLLQMTYARKLVRIIATLILSSLIIIIFRLFFKGNGQTFTGESLFGFRSINGHEGIERAYSNKRLGLVSIHSAPWYASEGSWSNWTISNHKQYCKKHGYSNYIENGLSDKRGAEWSKISSLLRHMEDDKHDWFWAIDVDIMITNGSIKAETFLDDNYELVYQRDWNWFNAGSFFIKNSEWSKEYLRKVLQVKKPRPHFFKEQAALYNVLDDTPGFHDKVKWMPQRAFNSYPEISCTSNLNADQMEKCLYQNGDFLIHFASGLAHSVMFPQTLIEFYNNATGLQGITIP
jgi:mannan polymerase II complex MNN10 subunit